MKTVSYTTVLTRAVELTGRQYPPLTLEAPFFRSFMAQAMRRFWEMFPWPDLMATTQYWFAETYDSATTYSASDVVYFPATEYYYICLRSSTGNDPATLSGSTYTLNSAYWQRAYDDYSGVSSEYSSTTAYTVGQVVLYKPTRSYYAMFATASAGTVPINSTYWTILTPFIRYIDPSTSDPEFGTVYSIYRGDPRVSTAQFGVEIYRDENGLLVREELPYVWIESRTVPPAMTTDPTTIPYIFSESVAAAAAGSVAKFVDRNDVLGDHLLALAEELNNNEADKSSRQEMQVRGITMTR